MFLPFIDRGKTRSIRDRTVYVTLGVIFVAEVAVLAVWGYLTPGRAIPDEAALLVLGGTALLVTLGSVVAYKLVFGGLKVFARTRGGAGVPNAQASSSDALRTVSFKSAAAWTSGIFVGLLAAGAFFIAESVNGAVALAIGGSSNAFLSLILSLAGLALVVVGTMFFLYRLDLRNGTIKRRVRVFETGWRE